MSKRKQYTDNEILDVMIEFLNSNENGNSTDYQKGGKKPTLTTIINRCGSWDKAVEKAKLRKAELLKTKKEEEISTKSKKGKRESAYSKEFLLQQVVDCIADNKGEISIPIYKKSGRKPSYTTIANRFGSWSNVVEKAKEHYLIELGKSELNKEAQTNDKAKFLLEEDSHQIYIQETLPLFEQLEKLEGFQEVAATTESHPNSVILSNGLTVDLPREEEKNTLYQRVEGGNFHSYESAQLNANQSEKKGFWHNTLKILTLGLVKK